MQQHQKPPDKFPCLHSPAVYHICSIMSHAAQCGFLVCPSFCINAHFLSFKEIWPITTELCVKGSPERFTRMYTGRQVFVSNVYKSFQVFKFCWAVFNGFTQDLEWQERTDFAAKVLVGWVLQLRDIHAQYCSAYVFTSRVKSLV